MATAGTLAAEVAVICHDSGYLEGPTATQADYLGFLNNAVEDWSNAGGLLPLAEATITQVAATFEYTIPADFVYISEIRLEDVTVANLFDRRVPYNLWSIAYAAGSTAKIRLDSRWFTPVADKKILVVGQKRQAAFALGDTVPAGLWAFLRERGIYHAARYLMAGGGNLAGHRKDAAELALKLSEAMLSEMPVEFRIVPGARPVPGR